MGSDMKDQSKKSRDQQLDRPYLTIITRHLRTRPSMFAKCVTSIANQSVTDIEHIVLIDNEGRGMQYANRLIADNARTPRGRYVYILDDDDFLTDYEFASLLRDITDNHDPDVVVFKFKWPQGFSMGELLPTKTMWEKTPMHGHIGSPCFAVRAEVFKEHAHMFDQAHSGDYFMIRSIWDHGHSFFWWNRVVGSVGRVSRGRAECAK